MATGALLAAVVVVAFLQARAEQEAISDQAEAQQEELTRQQGVANEIAQEDKSVLAAEADRQASSALVAMEVIGGAGSANDIRLQGEIGGVAGLDLARIEGNRRREIAARQSEKKSVTLRAKAGIKASQFKFFATAASAGLAASGGGAPSGGDPGFTTGTGGLTRTGQRNLDTRFAP